MWRQTFVAITVLKIRSLTENQYDSETSLHSSPNATKKHLSQAFKLCRTDPVFKSNCNQQTHSTFLAVFLCKISALKVKQFSFYIVSKVTQFHLKSLFPLKNKRVLPLKSCRSQIDIYLKPNLCSYYY